MLRIWTKATTMYQPQYFEWEVGKKLDYVVSPYSVDLIEASGDELGSILAHFANIPYMRNAKSQRWYGDMAKLIVSGIETLQVPPEIGSNGFKPIGGFSE